MLYSVFFYILTAPYLSILFSMPIQKIVKKSFHVYWIVDIETLDSWRAVRSLAARVAQLLSVAALWRSLGRFPLFVLSYE